MGDPALLLYAASGLAVASATALARRVPEHWPVAMALAWGLAGDLLARALRPAGGWAHPLEGLPRLGFHVAQVLLAGYPVVVLGAAAVVLKAFHSGGETAGSDGDHAVNPAVRPKGARIIPNFIPAAGALYLGALVVGYRPLELWGARLAWTYTGAQAVVVLGLAVVVARSWRRRPRRTPTASELVVLWLAGVEVANLAGPYLLGLGRWPTMARAAYALCYVVAILVHGGELWKRRSGRSAG